MNFSVWTTHADLIVIQKTFIAMLLVMDKPQKFIAEKVGSLHCAVLNHIHKGKTMLEKCVQTRSNTTTVRRLSSKTNLRIKVASAGMDYG